MANNDIFTHFFAQLLSYKTHKWSSSLLTVVLKLVNENAGSGELKQNVNTLETSSDASPVN